MTRKDDQRLESIICSGGIGSLEHGKIIQLVGYPCDLGVALNGGRVGSSLGPTAVAEFLPKVGPLVNRELDISLRDRVGLHAMETVTDEVLATKDIQQVHEAHRELVRDYLAMSSVVISIGGGNDQSLPNGLGWMDHLKSRLTESACHFLIINVDAHLDVRPCCPDGRPHSGSPFRQLIETNNGSRIRLVEFAAQGEQCSSKHVDYVLSHPDCEVLWLSQVLQPMRCDVKQLPFAVTSVAAKNLCSLLHKDEHEQVFFSFDIDSVRGADCPGVSCPGVRGLSADDALQMCMVAGNFSASTGRLSLFDISEFNPTIEKDRTCRLVCQMIYHFCLGYASATI